MFMERADNYQALDRLFRTLVEKHNRLEKEIRHRHHSRLTLADIRALLRIGHSRRERMSNLAQHLHLTVGTLTTTIDRLVGKGYVQRHRLDEDRRVVEVSLSHQGKEAFTEIENSRLALAERFFGDLDDEEILLLKKIFDKMAQG